MGLGDDGAGFGVVGCVAHCAFEAVEGVGGGLVEGGKGGEEPAWRGLEKSVGY